MSDDDAFEDAGTETPLSKIAGSFEELSEILKSSLDSDSDYDLRLKPFCEACTLVSVLFGCLGIAFKFAEMEYTAKVFFLSFLFVSIFLHKYLYVFFRLTTFIIFLIY